MSNPSLSKKARKQAKKLFRKERPVSAHPASPILPDEDIPSSALTHRQRKLMELVTVPLFEKGVMDPRFDHIFFLELFSLGWTPMRYVWFNGRPVLVGNWITDEQFDVVWIWWRRKHYKQRKAILRERRLPLWQERPVRIGARSVD